MTDLGGQVRRKDSVLVEDEALALDDLEMVDLAVYCGLVGDRVVVHLDVPVGLGDFEEEDHVAGEDVRDDPAVAADRPAC